MVETQCGCELPGKCHLKQGSPPPSPTEITLRRRCPTFGNGQPLRVSDEQRSESQCSFAAAHPCGPGFLSRPPSPGALARNATELFTGKPLAGDRPPSSLPRECLGQPAIFKAIFQSFQCLSPWERCHWPKIFALAGLVVELSTPRREGPVEKPLPKNGQAGPLPPGVCRALKRILVPTPQRGGAVRYGGIQQN